MKNKGKHLSLDQQLTLQSSMIDDLFQQFEKERDVTLKMKLAMALNYAQGEIRGIPTRTGTQDPSRKEGAEGTLPLCHVRWASGGLPMQKSLILNESHGRLM